MHNPVIHKLPPLKQCEPVSRGSIGSHLPNEHDFFFHLSSPRDINMMDFAQNHARVNGNVNVVPRKSHKKILVSTEPEQHQLGAHTSWSARVYASLYITFHIRPLPIKNMKWPISNIMIFFNHRSVFIRAKADFGFTLVSSVTCNGQ